jgi:hypothetical protein
MNTSPVDLLALLGQDVRFGDDDFTVDLSDGRTISIPLAWFPRLFHATPAERGNWRWIGQGIGIHWPELDEDIAVEDLVLGRPSGESQASLRRWLAARAEAQ